MRLLYGTSHKLKRTLFIASAPLLYYSAIYYINQDPKNAIDKILKSHFTEEKIKIQYSNISGKLFRKNTLRLSGIRILSTKDDSVRIEVGSAELKTSFWGYLLYLPYFISSLELKNCHGEILKMDSKSSDSVFNFCRKLKRLKINNANMNLGEMAHSTVVLIKSFDSGPYGLSLHSLFRVANLEVFLDGNSVISIGNGNGNDKNNNDKNNNGFSFTKEERNKEKKYVELKRVPELLKHQVHFELGNVLIKTPRKYRIRVESFSLVNLCLFLGIPLVYEEPLDTEKRKEKSMFHLEAELTPGMEYSLNLKAEWANFYFPRFVSVENAQRDQLFVFLAEFFKKRREFSVNLRVWSFIKMFWVSDRPREVDALLRVVDSITSYNVEEYLMGN